MFCLVPGASFPRRDFDEAQGVMGKQSLPLVPCDLESKTSEAPGYEAD